MRQQVGGGQLLLRHGGGLVEHSGVDVPGHVVVLEVDEGVGGEGRPLEVEGGGARLPVLRGLGDGAPGGGRAGRALGGRGVGGALLLGSHLGVRGVREASSCHKATTSTNTGVNIRELAEQEAIIGQSGSLAQISWNHGFKSL